MQLTKKNERDASIVSKNFNEFKNEIISLNSPRKSKVTNSLGVYDIYKLIRKNKWEGIGQPVTEHNFYSIIRKVNEHLAEELAQGRDISFPGGLGKLEIRKYPVRLAIENNRLQTNLPIDWEETLRLWHSDKDSLNKRTLVHREGKELFRIYYNKSGAYYINRSFYKFRANRDIRKKLSKNILEGKIEAFTFKYR
ncbi:MAG: hypothetical protein HUJ56_09650 [Erysipelotrichaceae bacterium]|nr:hypothetical protein [Erysipelotrichaceae bacterium]